MNAIRQAQNAYSQGARAIKTPRSTEYETFARVTKNLKTSVGKGRAGFARMAAALDENRRLWTILAADAADQGNRLPRDLRARILYLAEFTHLHSAKVLSHGASAAPLVEINTAIMGGLRGKGPGQ